MFASRLLRTLPKVAPIFAKQPAISPFFKGMHVTACQTGPTLCHISEHRHYVLSQIAHEQNLTILQDNVRFEPSEVLFAQVVRDSWQDTE